MAHERKRSIFVERPDGGVYIRIEVTVGAKDETVTREAQDALADSLASDIRSLMAAAINPPPV